jgi:hypothetical protein
VLCHPSQYIFPQGFLHLFFGVALNSDNPRRYICEQVTAGPCAGILNATADCETTLGTLPPTDGELNYIDGYSQGCRGLHAALRPPILRCIVPTFRSLHWPTRAVDSSVRPASKRHHPTYLQMQSLRCTESLPADTASTLM